MIYITYVIAFYTNVLTLILINIDINNGYIYYLYNLTF